jgi:predicted membrane metal-binding protein
MKTLIAGTVCFILTCLWIELSTQKPPSALLLLAISLFLMLIGALKIIKTKENKN